MIHIRACWVANGSRRNTRLIRKYVEGERELKLTKQLLEETGRWSQADLVKHACDVFIPKHEMKPRECPWWSQIN